MVDPNCKILWADKYGADLGCHPTTNYASGLCDAAKQAVITQHRLRYNMLGLWINNYLTTDTNRKLRALKYAYTFNA